MKQQRRTSTSHSDVHHGFAAAGQDFILFSKPSTLRKPGKGAFYDPTSWQDNKAFLFITAKHRLQQK